MVETILVDPPNGKKAVFVDLFCHSDQRNNQKGNYLQLARLIKRFLWRALMFYNHLVDIVHLLGQSAKEVA